MLGSAMRSRTEYGLHMGDPDFIDQHATAIFRPKTKVGDDRDRLILELGQYLGDLHADDRADRKKKAEEKTATDGSLQDEITLKAPRSYVLKIAAYLVLGLGGGGGAFYQFGGPAEAAHKVEAVTVEADHKIEELDHTKAELETLKTEIETNRRKRLNGRLSGVEQRVAAISGEVAGIRVGQDALLDATLTQKAAKAAKAEAKETARETEKQAKASLTADAKAE